MVTIRGAGQRVDRHCPRDLTHGRTSSDPLSIPSQQLGGDELHPIAIRDLQRSLILLAFNEATPDMTELGSDSIAMMLTAMTQTPIACEF
jgi:hypothetical protein